MGAMRRTVPGVPGPWRPGSAPVGCCRRTDVRRREARVGEWLNVGDTGHQAYLARPVGDAGPGILVLHAWWGLTPVFTQICDDLAAQGYVALAPGLFAGGATADTIPAAEAL